MRGCSRSKENIFSVISCEHLEQSRDAPVKGWKRILGDLPPAQPPRWEKNRSIYCANRVAIVKKLPSLSQSADNFNNDQDAAGTAAECVRHSRLFVCFYFQLELFV